MSQEATIDPQIDELIKKNSSTMTNHSSGESFKFDDFIEISYSDYEMDIIETDFESMPTESISMILKNESTDFSEIDSKAIDFNQATDCDDPIIEEYSPNSSKSANNMILMDGKKYFPCPESRCSQLFTNTSNLKMHYMIHTGEKPFGNIILHEFITFNSISTFSVCTVCNKSFNRKYILKNHERTHTGSRPYPCQYEGCNKSFKTSSDYMKHSRIHTGKICLI